MHAADWVPGEAFAGPQGFAARSEVEVRPSTSSACWVLKSCVKGTCFPGQTLVVVQVTLSDRRQR